MKQNMIELRDFSFTYAGKSHPALSNINLTIAEGSFVLVTGLSGCGKSTLAYTLCGFIPYGWPGDMEGDVLVDGQNTKSTPPEKIAGIAGLVQQDPDAQLCTFTVRQEVAFGLENLRLAAAEIQARLDDVCGIVNIKHLRDREVAGLSGGEKQRVALACILAMQPRILVLDEPTANLDPDGIAGLTASLITLVKQFGYTVIVVEHRIEPFIAMADRMLIIHEGRIAADGTPSEVNPVYRDMLDNTLSNSLQAKVKFDKARNRGAKTEADHTDIPIAADPLLCVQGMTVRRGGRLVLDDITFQLAPGEITAVMGANGSGKTTLFLSLLGYCRPDQGKIFYRGQDITAADIQSRVRDIGMVLQNPGHQILERTVWQEAILAAQMLKPAMNFQPATEKLIEEFSLAMVRDNSPFLLSMGEKKRLCAVSVLAYEPSLLLLDEPLAGQDAAHLDLLMAHLYSHCQRGGSVLMVCHHPEVVARYCHRLLFIDQGRVGCDAPPGDVFAWLKENGLEAYLP
ncbi:ATP-binding cassette domain-containing protein [Dehalobacter sp. DCM]|uniref:ABC transporter ATP-binding protein n=1 Tax=Dehalobacter sp. DCM TaxID=2907827 RepID=UPI0030821911|nr:ATP-binding cassette domain-containing protein [Dehalobacter sp. DCM]